MAVGASGGSWYSLAVRPGVPLALFLCAAALACKPSTTGGGEPETVKPTGGETAEARTPIAIYEALEALIADDKDSRGDRDAALEEIRAIADDGSPDYAFARAAVAGRVAEKRGLQAGELVGEAETWARTCIEREADYREGAATRMLGTLYVLAPPRLVEHGDSEKGLEILEGEVKAHPDRVEGHLRVAEAYIALGDPEPGYPHLCTAVMGRERLVRGDRKLLDRLIEDVGGEGVLGCAGGG